MPIPIPIKIECDGPTRDGPTRDGYTHDGPTRDGYTHDGPTRDGPSRDGPTCNGTTRDGPTCDGTTRDGPTCDGTTRDGPHVVVLCCFENMSICGNRQLLIDYQIEGTVNHKNRVLVRCEEIQNRFIALWKSFFD